MVPTPEQMAFAIALLNRNEAASHGTISADVQHPITHSLVRIATVVMLLATGILLGDSILHARWTRIEQPGEPPSQSNASPGLPDEQPAEAPVATESETASAAH